MILSRILSSLSFSPRSRTSSWAHSLAHSYQLQPTRLASTKETMTFAMQLQAPQHPMSSIPLSHMQTAPVPANKEDRREGDEPIGGDRSGDKKFSECPEGTPAKRLRYCISSITPRNAGRPHWAEVFGRLCGCLSSPFARIQCVCKPNSCLLAPSTRRRQRTEAVIA